MIPVRDEAVRDFFILLFAGIVLILAAFGCKSPAPIVNTETKTVTTRETVHDTAIKILQDSSAIQYLVECNDNQARLIEIINQRAGERAQVPQVRIVDRVLTAKCLVDSMTVYNTIKSRDTTRVTDTVRTVTVEVNKLSTWQNILIWAGKIALIVLIFVAAYIGFRVFKR